MIRSAKLMLLLLLAIDGRAQSPTPTPTPAQNPFIISTSTFSMAQKPSVSVDGHHVTVVDPDYLVIVSKWEPCIVRDGDHYTIRFHRFR